MLNRHFLDAILDAANEFKELVGTLVFWPTDEADDNARKLVERIALPPGTDTSTWDEMFLSKIEGLRTICLDAHEKARRVRNEPIEQRSSLHRRILRQLHEAINAVWVYRQELGRIGNYGWPKLDDFSKPSIVGWCNEVSALIEPELTNDSLPLNRLPSVYLRPALLTLMRAAHAVGDAELESLSLPLQWVGMTITELHERVLRLRDVSLQSNTWQPENRNKNDLLATEAISQMALAAELSHQTEPRNPKAASPSTAPKVYLDSWFSILQALQRKNNKTRQRQLRKLNDMYDGPILFGGQGTQPKVEQSKLLAWWDDLDGQFSESQQRQEDSRATVEDRYQYGTGSVTVVPGINGHEKRRRSSRIV